MSLAPVDQIKIFTIVALFLMILISGNFPLRSLAFK